MKRILFVDDEPLVLQGLQRMLYGMRQEWDMRFAKSGAEALQMMAACPADVVVSDMRMPIMNGAALLNEILRHYPKTVRFILSGYADMDMVMQCVGGTHQFLSKPCDSETLRSAVRRAVEMDPLINDDRIKSLVARMTKIPSLPSLYFDILKELRSEDASLGRVGHTIAQDPAMTAKMLQLVNSAFFGARRQLHDPVEAVMHLGLETIKSLVLSIHIFSELDSNDDTDLQIEQLQHHSLSVAVHARRICEMERQAKRIVDESFTAGLLHDIGRLVLVANNPGEYALVVARAEKDRLGLDEAEKIVLGASHAEIGGYLLSLWGLPAGIVESAIFHLRPGQCQTKGFSALTAVHAANVLEWELQSHKSTAVPPKLDQDYLTMAGVWGRIPVWRDSLHKGRTE